MISFSSALDNIIDKVTRSITNSGYIGKVTLVPAEKLAQEYFSNERIDEQIHVLRKFTQTEGKEVLEIGSGYGYFVVRGRLDHGLSIRGVEPSQDPLFDTTYNISQELLKIFNLPSSCILNATGEILPFPDNTFDIVYSSNVLEHVESPEMVLDEAIRVLRPEGILQFVIPNFGSWWEGHYGVFWFPNTPLWFAKIYVRFLGRDSAFLNTLQFINHNQLKGMLRKHQGQIEIVDWGFNIWEERLRNLSFSEWSSLGKLKSFLTILHKMKVVEVVIWIGKLLHWETPIILTLRKI
jgi:SAM-dependent methyltransferase